MQAFGTANGGERIQAWIKRPVMLVIVTVIQPEVQLLNVYTSQGMPPVPWLKQLYGVLQSGGRDPGSPEIGVI